MSKITFRADDALVEQLDVLDASKSEVMREALREFLDRHPEVGNGREVAATPEVRVDDEPGTPELTVNISFDGAAPTAVDGAARRTADDETRGEEENVCKQCGESLEPGHSFCPNCGEERERRAHCECGEEIQADWTFCPGCGRRNPNSDVFDRP
ncbi:MULTISPECIES: double zinc ribbon domain-containing protein [Halolamina]|uniref:Ribbon-helix-helix protein, copG family n=1 Tax=Halolamina pelagica TaxID=699431 RepID=A0A1I5PUH2_9EURY|nr:MULTISPECIES: zinc-ribbon domain-containing protein [Halolamina]NHX34950.1 ribbon-helix-helix protein, CopG family [Halolamina sp. R1-12]SFP37567.1 Ribbon-helix-helix protein, copG family [Halolamina pelagica]